MFDSQSRGESNGQLPALRENCGSHTAGVIEHCTGERTEELVTRAKEKPYRQIKYVGQGVVEESVLLGRGDLPIVTSQL